jgi:Peptidase family M28
VRRFSVTAAAAFLALGLTLPAVAAGDDAAPRASVDPAFSAALGHISATRLRATDLHLIAFGTRNTFSETLGRSDRGVFAARDWIAAEFKQISKASGGRLLVALDTFEQAKTDRTPRAAIVSSVIATLPGDDPSRGIIVMSSHYDSRNSDGNDATLDAPGADDNGSGTSAVLEAARVLAPLHFPATLVFACFDGEEQGLFGSAHYAHVLKDQGRNVEADLNNDIIGASVGHSGASAPFLARLFSEALPASAIPRRVNGLGSENDSPSRELARAVAEVDAAYVPAMHVALVYRADRFLRGGDQESFNDQSFAAVRFVEPAENYDHQHQTIRTENGIRYGDLPEFVDFDYLARVTQLNAAAMATLAAAPAAPEPFLLNKELSYDSALQWKPVPGAASYEVVWRSTTEPTWTHARNVGSATNVSLSGLSKDDWIFGVRTLDAAGHASVATYPQPLR